MQMLRLNFPNCPEQNNEHVWKAHRAIETASARLFVITGARSAYNAAVCRSSWQRSSTDDLPLLPSPPCSPFSSGEPLVPAIYARLKIPRPRPGLSAGAFPAVRCSRRIGVELDERSKRAWPRVLEQKFSKVIKSRRDRSPFLLPAPVVSYPLLLLLLLSCFFGNIVENLLCSQERVTSSDRARNLRFRPKVSRSCSRQPFAFEGRTINK